VLAPRDAPIRRRLAADRMSAAELLSELGLRLVQPAADGAHRHVAEQRDMRVGVAPTEVAQERRKAQRLPQSFQRGKNPVL